MLPTVYELLSADSDVAALVGEEIYRHGEAPEGVEGPYITWFVLSGPPENCLDGTPPVDRYELQVDCWGSNDEGEGDAGVEALALAVRNVLEAAHHVTAVGPNGRDFETRRYRIGMQVTWWYHRT